MKVALIHFPDKEPNVTFSLATKPTFMESRWDRRFEPHPDALYEVTHKLPSLAILFKNMNTNIPFIPTTN